MARLSLGTLRTVCFAAILWMCVGSLPAKSLYLLAKIDQNPTPIQTYDIQAAPGYLVAQAEQSVPFRGSGGVGLAIDTQNKILLLTCEGSNQIQLLSAVNLSDLGSMTAEGATNLAGIVVDQTNNRIYTLERQTNKLFVYDWTGATNSLAPVSGAPFTLPGMNNGYGLALDESRGRLYVTDSSSTTVNYFSTTSFQLLGSFTLTQSQQNPISIAVDSRRNYLYTGNAVNGKGLLVKYDLNTNSETSYSFPGVSDSAAKDQIAGLAVDEDTGYVYATTGNADVGVPGTLMIFDSDLKVLKTDFPQIGKSTGIVIPRAPVSYNPFHSAETTTTKTTSNSTYSTTTTLPAGTAVFYLDCPTNVAPGSQVTIPVRMSTGLNAQVASFQIDLQFNTAQLTYVGVTKGDSTISGGKDIMVESGNPGIIRFLVQGGNQTVLGDGVIMNVTFQINASIPGGSSLPIISANLYVSNINGLLIPSTCSDTGCNVIVVAKCGCDVSGDGQILVNDSQLLINMVLGATAATCDVNGDGAINITDVQIVVNAILDPLRRCLN